MKKKPEWVLDEFMKEWPKSRMFGIIVTDCVSDMITRLKWAVNEGVFLSDPQADFLKYQLHSMLENYHSSITEIQIATYINSCR